MQNERDKVVVGENSNNGCKKSNPMGYRSLNNLAVLMLEQEDHEGAEMVSRMALQANAHYLPALNNLGLALMKLGEYREAINTLQPALTLDPFHPQCLFLSAELHTLIDDYDTAFALYNRYLDVLIDRLG